jgi:hypothetical protein
MEQRQLSQRSALRDKGKFIHCRDCGEVHHVTALDKAPDYLVDAGKTQEIPADDWRAFMNQHAGHRLEALKILGEQHYTSGSSSDPMAVAYLEVTNGHHEFLLRRSRRSIGEPLRFECCEGRVEERMVGLEIQEREIRKELKLRFRWTPGKHLNDAQIDLFIMLFHEAVKNVDPHSVTITEPSYSDDNLFYAALDEPVKDSLLEKCARHFSHGEVDMLRRFTESHGAGSDVMCLVLRRMIIVDERHPK